MRLKFTLRESSALYRLLAEHTTDIILKTDREGFIVHATPAIEQFGVRLPNLLIWPHLLDLVHPSCREAVRIEHEATVTGSESETWVEFLALLPDGSERWFEIQMRCLRDGEGQTYGALSIMRSIEERRRYEERLFAAAMTDPLTGLTNRRAFVAMLQHLIETEAGGCLAIFDIDHFKAINMQHGQSVGDDVLVAFADFLRGLVRADDVVSRIGGESLGVLMLKATADRAEASCRRIITALSEFGQARDSRSFPLTASAGVARIHGSVDDTIRRAELALFFAKAKGRNRLEMHEEARLPWL
jgi:diguanylate cyclase (GGDEF)-like protein/PAS domain S-box-containing protein